MDKWSGEEDWAEVSFHVDGGERTFEWIYSKDGSASEGDDTAWIDDIVFPIAIDTTVPNSVYTNPQTYHVTRTLTFRYGTTRINRLKVWMPKVVTWDSQRNVVMEETTPSPISVWNDPEYSSGVLFWDFRGEFPRGVSLPITERFTYTCYEINYHIDLEKISAYDKDDPDYVLYTHPGKYLEANDPEIMETAQGIIGEAGNPYAMARLIYEWVIEHMIYRNVDGLVGAKFAFENGYGECGDYSALFVALCRAAGIPARPVVGRWATSSPGDWHVWAEFYLPGYGWIPVDATRADGTGRIEEYFGHLDNRRLIFNKTYSTVLRPEPYFFASDVGFLQTYYWEWHGFDGEIQRDFDYSIRPIAGYGIHNSKSSLTVANLCIQRNNSNDLRRFESL